MIFCSKRGWSPFLPPNITVANQSLLPNLFLHPPKFNSPPLKNDGWKPILSFGDGNFSGWGGRSNLYLSTAFPRCRLAQVVNVIVTKLTSSISLAKMTLLHAETTIHPVDDAAGWGGFLIFLIGFFQKNFFRTVFSAWKVGWLLNYTSVDPKQFTASKFRLKPVILIFEYFCSRCGHTNQHPPPT